MNNEELNYSSLTKGKWRNVTRNQVVTVLQIYGNEVEYFWEGSALPDKIHFKSREHFLRSYIKIKN